MSPAHPSWCVYGHEECGETFNVCDEEQKYSIIFDILRVSRGSLSLLCGLSSKPLKQFVSDMLKLSAPLCTSAPWRWDFPSYMQPLMGCAHSRTETCCHTYEEQLSVSWWVTAETWRAEPWPSPCWCHWLPFVTRWISYLRFVSSECCIKLICCHAMTAGSYSRWWGRCFSQRSGLFVLDFQCIRELGTRSVFWFSPFFYEDCVNKTSNNTAAHLKWAHFHT